MNSIEWSDNKVGAEGEPFSIKITEQEKARLELMRRKLRMTSKAKVLRFALDMVEAFILLDPANDTEDTHELLVRMRSKVLGDTDDLARSQAVGADTPDRGSSSS